MSIDLTVVTISAYVIGGVSDAPINVPLFVVPTEGTAVRNIDYTVTGLRTLTIEVANQSSNSKTIDITQIASDVSDTDADGVGTADKPETLIIGSATKDADGNINRVVFGDGFKPVMTTTINLIDATTPEAPPETDEHGGACLEFS